MSPRIFGWNSFARSLCFAALAGVSYPLFALLAGPLLGPARALACYLVGILGLYVAGLAPRLSRGLGAGLFATLLGFAVMWVAGPVADVALGAALILGLCRSGLLHGGPRARTLVTETALLVGGLALARFLFTPGALGVSLALWGFFLVQSVYFLIGGVAAVRNGPAGIDPFEVARARALALMEEQPR